MPRPVTLAAYFVILLLLAGTRGDVAGRPEAQTTATPDRQYALEASMLGYRGIGGDIDGVRNPTLWARTNETVRITIVNAEVMVHDVVLEKADIKSQQIFEKGASTGITFRATQNDTYFCSLPGHRLAGMEGRIEVSDEPRVRSEGVPVLVDGRRLNLDFEAGTLDDWTAGGDAFAIANEDPQKRVNASGGYWVSSGGSGSARKGTLTSKTFRVTHPYASFLVSGGAFASTRVEVVLASDKTVIYSISGADGWRLRPASVDLRSHADKDIFVRLVDEDTGAPTATYLRESPWAHITFDHFRFHDAKPFFPDEITPSDVVTLPPFDPIPHAGLSGIEAAKAMTLPKGFSVTLAAAEPDVIRPIAFALDDRGRLWVAEARTYPVRAPEGQGKDRILIFEDTNGDGRLDSRKIFIENLNLVSGIEVGFGGVWVGAAPNLLFIPIKQGTDLPAGPPQVMLDGWGYQDTHETLNTFSWGPDGWLYGAHGVFTHSNIGKPGAPDSERQRLNAGIWRFHPKTRVFEVFAEGTSNPWGLDFNDYGHAFTTVCVIEHLFHVVQGARYKRQAGRHFNPNVYDDIKTVADHVHWVGKRGPHAANSRSGSAGGGHAHAGAMIYLGGNTWPKEYRDAIFMNNIHGFRTNVDMLERKGSGYTATHGADFLMANDSWSQMINFRYGPDGAVHVIDWYDKNQCHASNPDVHQKSLGRIFKITNEHDRFVRVDLARMPSERLVELQLNPNDWYVRHARRLLQERGPNPAVHAQLKKILHDVPDVTRKLRAMWALHVTEGLTEQDLVGLLTHESEYVRSWAVYFLAQNKQTNARALGQLARLAREDSSALVRLYVASALQRIPVTDDAVRSRRWEVLAGLMSRSEDADDHNMPLMVWYAAEPAVPFDMPRALDLAISAKLPRLLQFTVQRIAAVKTQDALRVLTDRLGRTDDAAQQRELANGINLIVGKQ
ncbi:MAG TPA: PVC-type heme-binding CxxCH protein [Vicinamibacterales bacterium]|jgi:putative membrane-bound dehydrogenase-like protein